MKQESIHDVISHDNISKPLFNNRFLDYFTRVRWYVPLIVFVPAILGLCYYHFILNSWSLVSLMGLVSAGFFFWTFSEYVIHRFVFHFEPTSERLKKFFFTFHGVHHAYPNDELRLVMPPSLSMLLSLGFFFTYKTIFGNLGYGFTAGFLLGYLSYDMIHYAIHHFQSDNKWFAKIKKQHMIHHFKDPDNGFGVTSDFWDRMFKTRFIN